MNFDFDILRKNGWLTREYEEVRDFYIHSPEYCGNLNIEQLTLLEFCSYEYQYGKYDQMGIWQEEHFRSDIRRQRRLKLEELIKAIKDSKKSIYDIGNKPDDPYFLLGFVFRLCTQYDLTMSIPQNGIDQDLLEKTFRGIEDILKDPTRKIHHIECISDEKIKLAFYNALSYLKVAVNRIDKIANEFAIKGLFYNEQNGLGNVEDIIIWIYEGEQERPIARCDNYGWDEVIINAKDATFRKLGNDPKKYGLAIYMNDYPGTKINFTKEKYSGESIGLAIAIAIMAYFSKQDVKPEIAFTGTISPENFQINRVEHVRDKAYAACWYGIEKIIVPEDNVKDANQWIKIACERGAQTNTVVEGVRYLQDAEKIILQPAINIEEEFQKARRLKGDNAYEEAIGIFDRLTKNINGYIKDYPSLAKYIPESLYRRAIIHLHHGRIIEAGEDYKKAKEEYDKPCGFIGYREQADFYNSYSVYLFDLYNFKDALELANKSLEIKENPYVYPENEIRKVGSLNQKGQICAFTGDFKEAEEAFLKSLEIANAQGKGGVREADRARNYLGMLYIKWAKFNKALEHLKVVYCTDQQDIRNRTFCLLRMAELHFRWGYKSGDNNKYIESIKYADEGIQISSNNTYEKGLMLRYKGCSLRELGRYNEAIKCLEESYDFLNGLESMNINIIAATVCMELAQLYITKGNVEEAKKKLKQSIGNIKAFNIDSAQTYFTSAASCLNRAVQNLDDGNIKDVHTLIQQAIDRIPY